MSNEIDNFGKESTNQNMTEQEIGALIKELLKSRKITQNQLAKDISWSYETVNGTINFTDKNKWSLNCLRDILEYLDVTTCLKLP